MKFSKFFKLALFAAGLLVMASFSGCWKKSGEAIVLEKEHIDAAEVRPTPTPGPAANATEKPVNPGASPQESPVYEEYVEKELAPDEIVVDSIRMKKEVRGPSRDPRAHEEEQWIVKLQMVSDLRRLTAFTDRAHWEKLKEGDRIKVTYSQGKYTGSIWSIHID